MGRRVHARARLCRLGGGAAPPRPRAGRAAGRSPPHRRAAELAALDRRGPHRARAHVRAPFGGAGMIVRGATPADVGGIARVHVVAWREVYTALLPTAIMETNTEERRRALWERVAAEGSRRVFVAVEDGAIVGFVCGGAMPESI